MLNQNEKCLLRFISSLNEDRQPKDNLLDVIIRLGIKMKFNDNNDVYRLIDELNFEEYIKTNRIS